MFMNTKKYDQLRHPQSLVSFRHAHEETIENDLAYAMSTQISVLDYARVRLAWY